MTLVALASTLFDQQAALEKNHRAVEEQKQKKSERDLAQPQRQQSPSLCVKTEQPPPHFVPKTLVAKNPPSSIRDNSIGAKNNPIIPQNSTFQCCTREGFLSKLFSVLSDESLSHVLAWMPDGKAFTIVSSREFSKSGMVYDLFGIKKMSSFLRRLNQLGFARVRDPTDPSNLDVFRKPGFVAAAAEKFSKASQQRLDSPTSTLQFSPTDDKMNQDIPNYPLNRSTSGSSFVSMSPKPSTPVDLSSSMPSTEKQAQTRINSSDSSESSSAQSSWVCSTPQTGQDLVVQAQPIGHLPSTLSESSSKTMKNYLPLASMPPSIPVVPSGGPVLLRARNESYERSILAKPLQPPPALIVSSSHKTPVVTNKRSLELSPGTVQTLQLPTLGPSTKNCAEIRPPPMEFVAEFVRTLVADQAPTPMEVDENVNDNARPTSPFLGMAHVRALPKLQQLRDYIRLCEAAENEANEILGTSEARQDSNSSPLQASILAQIEALQGYKCRRSKNREETHNNHRDSTRKSRHDTSANARYKIQSI